MRWLWGRGGSGHLNPRQLTVQYSNNYIIARGRKIGQGGQSEEEIAQGGGKREEDAEEQDRNCDMARRSNRRQNESVNRWTAMG